MSTYSVLSILASSAILAVNGFSFVTLPSSHQPLQQKHTDGSTPAFSSSPALFSSYQDDEDQPSLITDDLRQKLAELSQSYPTDEGGFLAAARKRAEMKVESVNTAASDADWVDLKNQKIAEGINVDESPDYYDDSEEGSSEEINSSIEGFVVDQNNGDEPTLLL